MKLIWIRNTAGYNGLVCYLPSIGAKQFGPRSSHHSRRISGLRSLLYHPPALQQTVLITAGEYPASNYSLPDHLLSYKNSAVPPLLTCALSPRLELSSAWPTPNFSPYPRPLSSKHSATVLPPLLTWALSPRLELSSAWPASNFSLASLSAGLSSSSSSFNSEDVESTYNNRPFD